MPKNTYDDQVNSGSGNGYFRENLIIPGTRSGPTPKTYPILGKFDW